MSADTQPVTTTAFNCSATVDAEVNPSLAPAHLFRLPNELLVQIIGESSRIKRDYGSQFLGWPYPLYRHSQLKDISLACRRLYILCLPLLWRDKEFILPREDDEYRNQQYRLTSVQAATDILSQPILLAHRSSTLRLGSLVRTLSRDLTNGPHYDLHNSRLMAQLVCNLHALRIDFHPKARAEPYGLHFFIEYCPHLSELYLENCRDTYDDFSSLITHQRRLTSLTLLCCTIKQSTLSALIDSLKTSLRQLMLQRVLIEPDTGNKTHNITAATMAVGNVMPIPPSLYARLFHHQLLTQLALSESISFHMLNLIVTHSPCLEKLALILNETDPVLCTRCILLLTCLDKLQVLSLAFRSVHPLSIVHERLPCRTPASTWSYFASTLPCLRLMHVSASEVLLPLDFFTKLFHHHPQLSQCMFHAIAAVPPITHDVTLYGDQHVIGLYRSEWAAANHNDLSVWKQSNVRHQGSFLSYEQACEKGFRCFDELDRVCFVKGFEDWAFNPSSVM
ncbi:hypothetical protein BX666DRAFT_1979152 [Dichotomocladium elegans]|nr:hypothetical protein BX666DRAFT_1979152 [Dichotomocladium elegans]